MDKIYSIGFTKKNAKKFFELLKANNVEKVIDVRLNNTSQLAGFTKGDDLEYFLMQVGGIGYKHDQVFAPSKEILDAYKKDTIDWTEYVDKYYDLMKKRNVSQFIQEKGKNYWVNSCLLCSEEYAEQCHRSLAINEVIKVFPELVVIHLV